MPWFRRYCTAVEAVEGTVFDPSAQHCQPNVTIAISPSSSLVAEESIEDVTIDLEPGMIPTVLTRIILYAEELKVSPSRFEKPIRGTYVYMHGCVARDAGRLLTSEPRTRIASMLMLFEGMTICTHNSWEFRVRHDFELFVMSTDMANSHIKLG
jgi:hypothetical protein